MSTIRKSIIALTVVAGLSAPTIAVAGEVADFRDLMDHAYAPYRSALFFSNQGDKGGAIGALNGFLARWRAIQVRFGSAPPPQYSEDPAWAETVAKITALGETAKTQILADDLTAAHASLEKVRGTLAELRRRNQVFVFSDAVDAYHAAMEPLLMRGFSAETLDAKALAEVRERLGVLDYLAGQLKVRASAARAADPAFAKAHDGLVASLTALRAALDAADPATTAAAIKALKPAYAKLFVKFG